MDPTLVHAAQYLRTSTDHQQYSLDNQSDAIAQYAAEHGLQIVRPREERLETKQSTWIETIT